MKSTRRQEARAVWEAGDYLRAGRLIYDALRIEYRPGWAAFVLECYLPNGPTFPELALLLEIVESQRWSEGRKAFDALRTLLGRHRDNPGQYALIRLAENVAKVTANAARAASFDLNCGWRLAANVADLRPHVDVATHERALNALFCDVTGTLRWLQ